MSSDPIAIVTGGNSGVGLYTAMGLAERDMQVVITVRSPARGEAAVREIHDATGVKVDVAELDLASLASVRRFADGFVARYGQVDVLVNNAGFAEWGNERHITEDGFERMFGVNHLGHFLLTNLLLDVLAEDGRVITVSSEFGYKLATDGLHWDDLQSERSYSGPIVYGRSKLANIWFTLELANRLQSPATANAVCPGYVATNLGVARDGLDEVLTTPEPVAPAKGGSVDISSLPPPRTAAKGARGSVHLATDPSIAGVSGKLFRGTRELALVSPATDDPEGSRRLWEISEQLVGLG